MTDLAHVIRESARPTPRRRVQLVTVLGLALTLGMSLHSKIASDVIRALLGGEPYRSMVDAMTHAIGSQLIWDWTVVVVLLLIVVRYEHRTLGSIGWKRIGRRDLLWVAGAFVLSVTAMRLLPGRDFVQESPMQSIFALPVPFKVALVITAAITEEILHRAYIIERLAELTGRVWIGGVVTCVAFAAGHVAFFGLRTVLFVQLPGAILMTALYVRRRNLKASILLHLLIDLPILLPASMVAN